MDDSLKDIIAAQFIVCTLLYAFTMMSNKGKPEDEMKAIIDKWSHDSVDRLNSALDQQGYHIVAKETIPDAFLKM